MASFSDEDILELCYQIFEKLGVDYKIDDLSILLEENIYIELFRIMFPYLENMLIEIASKKTKPGQKIQDLINVLSSTVLKMDLSHIKGEIIAKGDKKHILNFLQLLYEVLKLLPPPNGKEIAMHSAPLSDKSSQKGSTNRRRTVQAIHDEFPSLNLEEENKENIEDNQQDPHDVHLLNDNDNENEENNEEAQAYPEGIEGDNEEEEEEQGNNKAYEDIQYSEPLVENLVHEPLYNPSEDIEDLEEGHMNQENEELEEHVETSKNIIKEVPKSEESSEYDKPHYASKGMNEKHKQSNRASKDEKKMNRDKSKKNLVEDLHSQKQIHKKLIGESLFGSNNQGKTIKVLQKDEAASKTIMFKATPKPKVSEETKIKELLANSIHSEGQKSRQSDKKELKEMDQNAEFMRFNENMYEILADNIEKIRESLKNMKKTTSPEEEKTKEQLIRQKNEYKRLLKDYLQYHKIKENQSKSKNEKDEKFFLTKLQQLQSKDMTFQQMVESEEKGLYMKLRDEKINYLRKIHRIIFELEKRKIIDENKQYKDNRRLRNEETRYVLESVENAYKDKINMLKEKLVSQRQEKAISETAHRQVLSKLEKELKQEKQRQLNELKDAWRCEKEKFDAIVMDDGKLEQKIMALYNKY